MSNLIKDHSYDPETRRLTIHFFKGQTPIHYESVPAETADSFANAGSKGSFFHQNIRNVHKWTPG